MQPKERLACGDLAGLKLAGQIVTAELARSLECKVAFKRGPFSIAPLPLLLHLLSIRSMIWRHGGLPSPS
jgi:hypothetical protein